MNPTKFLKTYQADIILAIIVVLISITSFNLGKISANQHKKLPISITEPGTAVEPAVAGEKTQADNKPAGNVSVVASKNSTGKLYHFPWCSGAARIAEKNKITFSTEAAAIAAGYTLAGNCTR